MPMTEYESRSLHYLSRIELLMTEYESRSLHYLSQIRRLMEIGLKAKG